MAYAFDALWLTIPGEGAVVRFDPVTEETEVVTTDLPNPTGIVAGADSLWVSLPWRQRRSGLGRRNAAGTDRPCKR